MEVEAWVQGLEESERRITNPERVEGLSPRPLTFMHLWNSIYIVCSTTCCVCIQRGAWDSYVGPKGLV